MKKMKILPFLALPLILSACATQPPVALTSVGQSARAPDDVAQCIAKTWADQTQQPITIQTAIANDVGVDVLLPGQPPYGSAAIVRPSRSGTGSWVGYRTVGQPVTPPASIDSCL